MTSFLHHLCTGRDQGRSEAHHRGEQRSVETVGTLASPDCCAADPGAFATWLRGYCQTDDRVHHV